MKCIDAKRIAIKIKGSKILRVDDEHVVVDKNGELINEVDPSLNTPDKVVSRVKGVGPNMRWKSSVQFKESKIDIMDTNKLYKGSFEMGKKR